MLKFTLKDKLNEIFPAVLAIYPSLGRFLIKAFGIKFKYRNAIYLSRYYQAQKSKEDITTLPKAEGFLRDMQLANLVLLKELDTVCRENNLDYWLIYGTQLGATRHKGYIPWDDDIDTAMPKDHYEKLIQIFDEKVHNKDLYLELCYNKHTPCMFILKVKHRKLPFLFVDIFLWEFFHSDLNEEECNKLSEKIIKIRKEINQNKSILKLKRKKSYEYVKNTVQNIILENKTASRDNKPVLFECIDFPHGSSHRVYKYSDVYPLKDTEFEGINLKTINKPELLLLKTFGKDYMDYPSQFSLGHIQNQIVSKKEYKIMKELINTL